ncbi:unnamed protein product, partial [Ectocarpus sp. 12 AP-2014]
MTCRPPFPREGTVLNFRTYLSSVGTKLLHQEPKRFINGQSNSVPTGYASIRGHKDRIMTYNVLLHCMTISFRLLGSSHLSCSSRLFAVAATVGSLFHLVYTHATG